MSFVKSKERNLLDVSKMSDQTDPQKICNDIFGDTIWKTSTAQFWVKFGMLPKHLFIEHESTFTAIKRAIFGRAVVQIC